MELKPKKYRRITTAKEKNAVGESIPGRKTEAPNGIAKVVHGSKRGVHTATITSKGQITVPMRIRKHLQVDKGDRIEFLIGTDGKVTLMPAIADVRKLKGIVGKPDRPVTVEDMNRIIEAEAGKK